VILQQEHEGYNWPHRRPSISYWRIRDTLPEAPARATCFIIGRGKCRGARYTNCQTRGVEVHGTWACSGRADRAVTVQLPAGPETRTGSASTKTGKTRCDHSDGWLRDKRVRGRRTDALVLGRNSSRIAVRSPLESLHDSVQYVSQGPR